MATNAKLLMGFNKRVWHDTGAAGGFFADAPLQCGWEFDAARRRFEDARRTLETWLATPYQAGNPATIATARQQLDALSAELARLEGLLEAGIAPLRARVASAQSAYDSAMCPLEAAVTTAQAGRQQALAPLQLGIDNGKPPVATGEALITRLQAVPAEKAAEWKKKKKFDVAQFWRERPPV